MNNQFYLL